MSSVSENLDIYKFNKTHIKTLVVKSTALKKNPLQDPFVRANPVVCPKLKFNKSPVVFVLSGFSGNGPKTFAPKTFAKNAVDVLGEAIDAGDAPLAHYVFVDAMTYWGGSQFIDSAAQGRYAQYVLKDLVKAVHENFDVQDDSKYWCITGGSSGGYGALNLATSAPDTFGLAAAIAPDSYFELSLLPELLAAKPFVDNMGGIGELKKQLKSRKLLKNRNFHQLINAVAMVMCYVADKNGKFDWPFAEDGKLILSRWKKWQKHDPVHFIKRRHKNVEKLYGVYLDVGTQDQFYLQYGSRQLRDAFKGLGVKIKYSEFDGNHFDIGDRRIEVWRWLKQKWSRKNV